MLIEQDAISFEMIEKVLGSPKGFITEYQPKIQPGAVKRIIQGGKPIFKAALGFVSQVKFCLPIFGSSWR